MIEAWIVVREEKHVDDKFWVCIDREDTLKIAKDVTEYWKTQYDPQLDEIDETCYGNTIFNYNAEGMFWVYVRPQQIRERGEFKNIE
jgi:hypothetical protein